MDEFAVFIDESGDEGFVFKADGSGSTRWLALSALVVRQEAIQETDAVIDEVKAVLGKTDPAFCPHFRKLCHEQRVATGIYYGFARNLYGHTEPRYAEILAPIVYDHDGRHLGYGLEVWPREVDSLLDTDEKLAWVRKIYR